jgi:WD40 repeat protein
MSADKQRLATFSADGTARVWDIGSALLSEGVMYATHNPARNIDPGGADVAAGRIAVWAGGPDADGNGQWETVVLDAATGEIELTLVGGSPSLSADGRLLAYRPHEASPMPSDPDAPELSPEARRIGEVRIIDIDSGAVIAELDARCNAYHDGDKTTPTDGCIGRADAPDWTNSWTLNFSADGSLLSMTDGADSALTVWDVKTGEVVISELMPGLSARLFEFSPDGTTGVALFAPTGGGTIAQIYELDSFSVVGEPIPLNSPQGLVFTPDQSMAILPDFGGGISYYDASDFSLIERVEAHQGSAQNIDISPDGTSLATAGEDGVRVWSVADHSLLVDVGFDGANIRFVRFLDDTHLLLVPQVASSAIVVTLDPLELAAVALAKVTRAFTETECLTYDIDPCPTTLEALRNG